MIDRVSVRKKRLKARYKQYMPKGVYGRSCWLLFWKSQNLNQGRDQLVTCSREQPSLGRMNSSNNWQKYGSACKQEDDGVYPDNVNHPSDNHISLDRGLISFVSDNHVDNNKEILMYLYGGSIVNQWKSWILCFKHEKHSDIILYPLNRYFV